MSEPQSDFGFIQRHPLFCYFFLAYAISWLGWLPSVLAQNGLGLLPIRLPAAAIAAGSLGPVGAGFLLTALTSGKAGLRRLLHRFLLWRVGIQWYGFALCGLPALLCLGALIIVPEALTTFPLSVLSSVLLLYAVRFLFQLFMSPLFEEPGWRGFALPRLQASKGALKGSLILGVFWAGWHFPLFLIPTYSRQVSYGTGPGFFGIAIPFGLFALGIVAATLIITWAFNHTKGSMLLVMLIHASNDSFPLASLFPQMATGDQRRLAMLLGYGALALVLLAISRGKLGYQLSHTMQERGEEE
ncbi:MAG TPA: CPBP family intramembrane glutamic endopeptidase [Ktedonobacteraceae bacterium]|nr:CPBP family intramembrane glutamic endopeptidase [Ktedonobacteraceae bacterium]